jgi:P pilus assembly chaperone PapD
MNRWTQSALRAALLAAPFLIASTPACAGIGDLLVAPTRIVLDGRRGTEVILNNIGEEPATYRISVEFRRMTEDGGLVDVAEPTADDQKAADMVVYAPRKVVLAPHQPQAIRIAARPPQGLPDGEYRVHLLFRAIPPANPVVQAAAAEPVKGLHFQLTPVYGVTIPVIVRLGNLQATAGIANVHLEQKDGKPFVSLDLSRSGQRSTFGEVRVLKAGVRNPIAIQKAVAVYKEIGVRHLAVPLDDAHRSDAAGPVTVQYVEIFDDGSHVIAETQAVLR